MHDLSQLANAFDASVESIVVFDLNGRTAHANSHFLRMTGYERSELVGRDMAELCTPGDGVCLGDVLGPISRGESHAFEVMFKLPDGKGLPVSLSVSPLRSRAAEVIAGIAVARSLAHGTRPKEMLEESEAKFRGLFENSRDAILIADAESGILIDANEAACRLLERAKHEIIGMHQWELHEPEKAEFYREVFRRHIEEGKAFEHDLYVKAKSGHLVPVDIVANVLDIAGRRVIQGAFRDVTERKALQEELIQSERMSAIGQLASGIAHEFNNLHCAIQGHIELALQNDALPAKARDQLEMAVKASQMAAGITRQLLTFSRHREPQKQLRDLAEVVEGALRIIRHEFESEGVDIVTHYAAMPSIVMDPVQISQVVMNLILNARQAMAGSTGMRLTLETGLVKDRAFIRVSDTGCGIPPQELPRIFEPFFTTKGAKGTGGTPGTGLGLSVCDTIVRDHDGEIEVTTTVNGGSVFTVWLSTSLQPSVERPAGDTEASHDLEGVRVLLVDDEAAIRSLMVEVLQVNRCDVEAVSTGREGLRLATKGGYDVLLLDLQMPDMPGEAILSKLASMPEDQRPAVLIVTGKADVPDQADFGRFGICDFLFKPFSIDDLRAAVSAAAQHRKAGV